MYLNFAENVRRTDVPAFKSHNDFTVLKSDMGSVLVWYMATLYQQNWCYLFVKKNKTYISIYKRL
jgi:hypothetical protein